MSDQNVPLYCPKCGKGMNVVSGQTESLDAVTCAACGGVSKTMELKTAEGKTLSDHLLEIARKTFKGLK